MTDDPLIGLAARAAGGDETAFAVIVRATQADVARTCLALSDPFSADDLVQDTYLRAFASLASFRGESSVRTWLLTIARRACIDEIRRRSRRRALFRALPQVPETSTHTGVTEIEMLLADLPTDRREAFVLTQLIGLSYAETAVVCACPVGTVRSRVARARADLVAQLDTESQSGSA